MTVPYEDRVELHLHTKYSALDGLIDVQKLIAKAASDGWKAVAITDTGNVQAFPEAYSCARRRGVKLIYGMEARCFDDSAENTPEADDRITILVREQRGLKNLYELVSIGGRYGEDADLRIPISALAAHRDGLLIGSGSSRSAIVAAVLKGDTRKAAALAESLDYIELLPRDSYAHLQPEEFASVDPERLCLSLAELAETQDKLLIAAGDVRYLYEEEKIAYRALCSTYHGSEPLAAFHYRSTEEMLEEFAFLGAKKAYEAVVTNTSKLADLIDDSIEPVPNTKYMPVIEGAEEEIREKSIRKAKELYGDELPQPVSRRLMWELDAIERYGYAVFYSAADRLVDDQKELLRHTVGVRGSVASSLVAYFLGITEVNPLPGHYLCHGCKHSEFPEQPTYTAYDLKRKTCPVCGNPMARVGFHTVAETFFGLNGSKEPDIDLNFANGLQNVAGNHLAYIFGEENILRAGGIRTLSERLAEECLERYAQDHDLHFSEGERGNLLDCLVGVKRCDTVRLISYVVVPAGKPITDITPVGYYQGDTLCTHFDYHSIAGTLIHFDLLKHRTQDLLHDLGEKTGVPSTSIDIDAPEILSLCQNQDTIGLPGLGSDFGRYLLKTLKIHSLSQLIKIFGFAHGTDVWQDNAELLAADRDGETDDLIAFRDDVYQALIRKGADRKSAYEIMEFVRMGKLYSGPNAWNHPSRIAAREEIKCRLKELGVEDWVPESMEKIRYLFPKAHAAAYLVQELKLAWYKQHYPVEFFIVLLRYYQWDNVFKPDDFRADNEALLAEIERLSDPEDPMEQIGYEEDRIKALKLVIDARNHGIRFVPPGCGSDLDAFAYGFHPFVAGPDRTIRVYDLL